MLKSRVVASATAAVMACAVALGGVSPAAAGSSYGHAAYYHPVERVLIVKNKAYVFRPHANGYYYNSKWGYWHPKFGFMKPIKKAHYWQPAPAYHAPKPHYAPPKPPKPHYVPPKPPKHVSAPPKPPKHVAPPKPPKNVQVKPAPQGPKPGQHSQPGKPGPQGKPNSKQAWQR